MRTIALGLVAVLSVACGSADPAACPLGRVEACACPGGPQGAQECGPGGVWSACVCLSADAGTDVAVMPADASDAVASIDREPTADAMEDASDTGCPANAERLVSGGCRCVTGYSLCEGSCVDSRSDARNCGACGRACAAGEMCLGGGCAGFVDAGQDVTDGAADASCASSTPGNCCGVACVTPAGAATSTCSAGRCGFVCTAGYGDCDGVASNGCEVDLSANASNCGACGAACADGRSCVRNACVCRAGRGDCDGNPANGCETSTNSDRANCGECGHACRNDPFQSCVSGVCR